MIGLDNVCFVDTETSGLDADRHEIWEVGLIVDEIERRWFLPVDLGRADPYALKVGAYHDRHPHGYTFDGTDGPIRDITTPRAFAYDFAQLTYGRHLVGVVISFDAERLSKLLKANGACPGWHYHLVDVEAMVAGKLGVAPPWDSNVLSRQVGIEPDDYARHTAIGDAQWARALYLMCVT